MKLSSLFFVFIFCFQTVYSQNNFLTKEEIKKQLQRDELVFADSDEDVKKIEALIEHSKKINYKEGIIIGKMNILSYLRELSDYKGMLQLINEIEALNTDNNTTLSKLYLYKSDANMELGIEKAALENLQDALKFSQKIEDPDKRHLSVSYVYNALGIYYEKKSYDSMFVYIKKELSELELIGNEKPEINFKKHISIALNKINIGNYYVDATPQRLDLAAPYFMDIYNYRTTHPDVFEELNLPILCGVGNFYLAKMNYEEALKLFNEVLVIEKNKNNLTYRSYAYFALADTYEGLHNASEQAKYSKLYAALNDSINKAAKKEVGQQFEKLVTEAEKKKDNEHSSNLKVILTATGCFILVSTLFLTIYWKRKNKILRKKYEAIISQIKSENQTDEIHQENLQEITETQTPKTPLIITDDTLKFLLVKLDKFEKSQLFRRKDVSRPWLATHLNTNTKYMTEVIKIQSGTTFTNYIHNLRINYIIRKLVEDPKYREYKIEYLAEECGYGSRQVFITAFKSETGFTPSYFIENLKSDALKQDVPV